MAIHHAKSHIFLGSDNKKKHPPVKYETTLDNRCIHIYIESPG